MSDNNEGQPQPITDSHNRAQFSHNQTNIEKSINASQGQAIGGQNPQYVQSVIVAAPQATPAATASTGTTPVASTTPSTPVVSSEPKQ